MGQLHELFFHSLLPPPSSVLRGCVSPSRCKARSLAHSFSLGPNENLTSPFLRFGARSRSLALARFLLKRCPVFSSGSLARTNERIFRERLARHGEKGSFPGGDKKYTTYERATWSSGKAAVGERQTHVKAISTILKQTIKIQRDNWPRSPELLLSFLHGRDFTRKDDALRERRGRIFGLVIIIGRK